MSNSLWSHGLQQVSLISPLSPGVCCNSCPLSQWCRPTISSSVVPFSFSLQSFPALETFLVSQLFTSDGQSIEASASASATILLTNIQSWFLLGLPDLICLLSKGVSRVFSSIIIWKHQFFGTQLSWWSNSHMYYWKTTTWLLENHSFDYMDLSQQSDIAALKHAV